MTEVNPRDFGALEREVSSLKEDIIEMRNDMRELKTLLQQARGGWAVARWVIGTAFASGAAIMAYIQTKLP